MQAFNIALVFRLSDYIKFDNERNKRVAIYFISLLVLAYGWWYFDPLVVFTILLAFYWLYQDRYAAAGSALALGTLTKWFPILLLPAIWRYRSRRQAFIMALITVGITLVVFGTLYFISPEMTVASIRSLPDDFVADQRQFVNFIIGFGQGFAQHTRNHFDQIQDAIKAARASA